MCDIVIVVRWLSWCFGYVVFFFKQKTAYDMRISDWSSDVCSSDLSPGDIPDALRKRYFSTTSKWSGEPAYFTSAQAKEPAFRDQGRRLITSSESDEVV